MILNSSNSSTSPLVDGCVVYKTSGDNFSANHSKIITQANDNISASAYTNQASAIIETNNNNISSTSTTISLSMSSPLLYALSSTSSPSANSKNNREPNSLIYMYSPYTTVTSSSSPPQNHYHQIVTHRPTGVTTIDEVIADTLKDEHCTMIDGINNSPNGVLVANVNYNGNHSAANSDDGEHNSRSPHDSGNLTHNYDYDGIQSFTHLTNATDTNQATLSHDSVYSGTALFTPNSSVTTAATSSIIHPVQTYESVMHPTAPGRYVTFLIILFKNRCAKRKIV